MQKQIATSCIWKDVDSDGLISLVIQKKVMKNLNNIELLSDLSKQDLVEPAFPLSPYIFACYIILVVTAFEYEST